MSEEANSIFDLECCPHCGGGSGFTYKVTIYGEQFQPWKGSQAGASFVDSVRPSLHGAYRCDDCKKIIKTP